jgi:hypothetical protein
MGRTSRIKLSNNGGEREGRDKIVLGKKEPLNRLLQIQPLCPVFA